MIPGWRNLVWTTVCAGLFAPSAAAEEPASAAKGWDLERRRADHWAWHPVRAAEPPGVGGGAWPRGAIDRFILAKLEPAGLEPAAPADRRTLLRRVHFDLIGLPPTARAVGAFVRDASPNAYEKVVDELLASRHFGERWGRHWLDLVRYAETYGHEFDYAIHHAYRYRDYVIRALNADVPYDQFVREHIAGDLLPEARRDESKGRNESVIGTAFYWFGEQAHSPVDVREAESERVANQIDVLTKTFLGLTVACARCHDHKFDAILAVSGRLDRQTFGEPMEIHLTSFMPPEGRPAQSGPLDGAGQRSVYVKVRRNFLSPMMMAFDTPLPFSTVGRRSVSNVPAQALILLNDPFVNEQAAVWATSALAEKDRSPGERLDRLYLGAFSRPPSDTEKRASRAFLAGQGELYGLETDAWRRDARVWTDLCHALLNLKEFVFLH